MGDKTDPKAKENSDRLNSKIKWPFAIFFVIAIFVAISVVARFYQDKFNDLYTPALYLFSTIAQTMGALLGIGLALLYTVVPNLKVSELLGVNEPLKRMMYSDELINRFILLGVISIFLAITGLLFIVFMPNGYYFLRVIINLICTVAVLFSLFALGTITFFIIYRLRIYVSPILIFEVNTIDVNKNYIDIMELALIFITSGIKINIQKYFNMIEYNKIVTYCDILLQRIDKDIKINKDDGNLITYYKVLGTLIDEIIDYININDVTNTDLLDVILNKSESIIISSKFSLESNQLRFNSDLCRQVIRKIGYNVHIQSNYLLNDKYGNFLTSRILQWARNIVRETTVLLIVNNLGFESSLFRFLEGSLMNVSVDKVTDPIIKDIITNFKYIYIYDELRFLEVLFYWREYIDLLHLDEYTKINFSLSRTFIFKYNINYNYIHNILQLPFYKPVVILCFFADIKPIILDDTHNGYIDYGERFPINELRYLYALINNEYYTEEDFISKKLNMYCDKFQLNHKAIVEGIALAKNNKKITQQHRKDIEELLNNL